MIPNTEFETAESKIENLYEKTREPYDRLVTNRSKIQTDFIFIFPFFSTEKCYHFLKWIGPKLYCITMMFQAQIRKRPGVKYSNLDRTNRFTKLNPDSCVIVYILFAILQMLLTHFKSQNDKNWKKFQRNFKEELF